ncbi:MAG: HNH endonuclease [Promethearchaeota archaeon]
MNTKRIKQLNNRHSDSELFQIFLFIFAFFFICFIITSILLEQIFWPLFLSMVLPSLFFLPSTYFGAKREKSERIKKKINNKIREKLSQDINTPYHEILKSIINDLSKLKKHAINLEEVFNTIKLRIAHEIELDEMHRKKRELRITLQNSPRHIPSEVRKMVWERDKGMCVLCGSQERLEFDHIIPFSKGGAHTAKNIRLLCLKCNRRRKNRIGDLITG